MTNKTNKRELFDRLSRTYDWNNSILSLGLHHRWKQNLCRRIPAKEDLKILDLATGTGDILIKVLGNVPVGIALGVDFSHSMILKAVHKVDKHRGNEKVFFIQCNMEQLPLLENYFDCVTISFGIRNVQNREKALGEAYNSLRLGGKLIILEFSLPSKKWVLFPYMFYLDRVLPILGSIFSGEKKSYRYLKDSIKSFPESLSFMKIIRSVNFKNVCSQSMCGGIVTVYEGYK